MTPVIRALVAVKNFKNLPENLLKTLLALKNLIINT